MPADQRDQDKQQPTPAEDKTQRQPLDREQWIARALAAAARHKRKS